MVMMHSALLSPAVAVIVASPAATPVTTPSVTVATASLLLVHVTVLSVAFSGNTVAVSVSLSPTVIVVVLLFKSTLATDTVADFFS